MSAPVRVWWWAAVALVAACHFDSGGVAIPSFDATAAADAARAGSPVVPCSGPLCECRDADTCAASCEGDDCSMRCEHAGTCANRCGQSCAHACASSGACELSCGDDCDVQCESVGACAVVCGQGCVVECRDTSSCTVEMIDGVVKCQRANACQATCRDVGGGRRTARRGDDGTLFCDAAAD